MANSEHVEILMKGVKVWNKWRDDNPAVRPDLTGVDLEHQDFDEINFEGADLTNANLFIGSFKRANFQNAKLANVAWGLNNLSHANFASVQLSFSSISESIIEYANFERANLRSASFYDCDLAGANFRFANLAIADFNRARLFDADFTGAKLVATVFGANDLSSVIGLDAVDHAGPSVIDVGTLYKSAGKIPEVFLRGCGVPDDFITFIPSHFGIQQAIQFYSCFISYSSIDEEFTRRLYSRMRDEKLRVWFAPEDVKGGEKLYEQIERAIQIHDRLLIILSESSMRSRWVMTEIRRARKVELKENRRKLFPIRLADFDALQSWECFDADTGEDLASEVRQYYIPDFSNWKDHDAFERAFERLLRDLKAEEKKA